MMGPDPSAKGGIASVVKVYVASGLFQDFNVKYLITQGSISGGKRLKDYVLALGKLILMLVTREVALAHVHMSFRGSFIRKAPLVVLCRIFGVPTIVHIHSGGFVAFYESECGCFMKWMIRRTFDLASCIIVLSSERRRWVQGITANPHVVVLFNPVVVASEPPQWTQRKCSNVLFLGRVWEKKGVYDLLEAARLTLSQVPDLRVCLGGEGELDEVQARAAELGLAKHVDLLGWVGEVDKQAHLDAAAAFVLPSYYEGMPMGILEAMSRGLPVVASRVGGIPDVITDGVEGFLVDAGDIRALADRLGLLLTDRSLAERMGRAGRERVESTFAAEVVVPQVAALYVKLLRRGAI